MKNLNLTFISSILFFLLFSKHDVHAQTAGISTLSSIESKANTIENLQNQITEIENNLKRWRLEKIGLDELLQKKLSDKLNEIATSSVWMNRLKSAQSGWKEYNPGSCSAGGPPPICSARHWYSVPVSEALREYDALKNKELGKVHDQIEKLKEDYDTKISNGEKQVAKKYDDIDKLRQEIIELSKEYKEKVIKDANSIQATYVNELIRIVADKHYIEDRINIINTKSADLNKEEEKNVIQTKDKINKQVEEEKLKLSEKIEDNKTRLQQLMNSHKSRLEPLKAMDGNLKQKLSELRVKLKSNSKLTGEELAKLQTEIAETEEKLFQINNSLLSFANDFATAKQQIESENKEFADKGWDLTVNLSKKQQEAIDAVKNAFGIRRKILEDAKVARSTSLEQKGAFLLSKKAASRKKFMEYAEDADKERVRLINACQKAGCSCFGIDTHGTIVGNWNKGEGCVGEMESAHHSGDPIYGCVEETAVYRQHYSSQLNGLSDSDLEALQRQSGKTRYDLILKKITN